MPDELSSATFDDYSNSAGTLTVDAPVAAPPSAPSTAAATAPAPERPRDESGKFVAVAQLKQDGEVEPATPAATPQTASSDMDAQARALGWKPLEEFGGDPRKWVEARVWVENAPLVSQIKAHKQKVREQNRIIEAQQAHYRQVHEAAYHRAMQELAAQKRQAIVEQDPDRVDEVERQMAQASAERAKLPVANTVDPAYLDWKEANPTIVGDPEMVQYAIRFEKGLMELEPDIDKRLEATTEAVRLKFPDRFKQANPRRHAPSIMESGASPHTGGNHKKFTVSDLTPDERMIMNKLVGIGQLTEAQYLKDAQESRNGIYTLDI